MTRADREKLLLELTQLPTASGHEWRVHNFIRAWASRRAELSLGEDPCGNLLISIRGAGGAQPPVFITAHTDHPAFVVEKLFEGRTVEVSFRGGVMPVFFEHAPITIHTANDVPFGAILQKKLEHASPVGDHYQAELDTPADATGMIALGDVATWTLPPAQIDEQGLVHTHACDDLAALACALCAMDDLLELRRRGERIGDVRLLFTRAEEIGFVGAIGAMKLASVPAGARIIALENSRAFAESPVGGGPIVRVGDRLSVFTPWLTSACAQRAEELFGGASTPRASETGPSTQRPWQRKLMAGGACEASVYCQFGFDATCLCLPLGNYHNMPSLDALQNGTYDATSLGPPRCQREYIHRDDFHALTDLLVGLGQKLPEPGGTFAQRIEKMYSERKSVLENRA